MKAIVENSHSGTDVIIDVRENDLQEIQNLLGGYLISVYINTVIIEIMPRVVVHKRVTRKTILRLLKESRVIVHAYRQTLDDIGLDMLIGNKKYIINI